MADQAQERTEEATPKRKRDARKKGSVAKSQEVISSIAILGLLMVVPAVLNSVGQACMMSFKNAANHIPQTVEFSELVAFMGNVGMEPFKAILPLMFIAMGLGLVSNVAQVGFMMTPEALKPKWERLNPASGLKRIFSRQAGMEGLKSIVKTVLFGYLAYGVIQQHWEEILTLSWKTPSAMMMTTGSIMHGVAVKVGSVWLVLAAVDYFFQRKQLDRQLRMSKEEIKQEFKESEQSPELKGAMARRRRQLTKGRGLKAVSEATVVITNPTHYAVAIKYEPGKMHAPQVVAKGVDHLAAKIRAEAEANKIPIVPNPPLARRLHKLCEVGDFIPRDMFQAVAEVLAFVYRTLKKDVI
jgi:flagellar biosynthetic protein FlhB